MQKKTGITIIIPTYNEEIVIVSLIRYLKLHAPTPIQIIVSDGGSTDNTTAIASREGAMVVNSNKKGRAVQMNYGASFACESILYFVHADCLPPVNFYSEILKAVENGYSLGRFCTRFDSKSYLLKINAFFTRFDWFICYGGDQTFFIMNEIFQKLNGFDENMVIMEDFDIVERARKSFRYAILKDKVLVSARKYNKNSWVKVQRVHHTIMKMYRKGVNPQVLSEKYKQLLDYS